MKKTILTLSSVLMVGSLNADWQLIDDLEAGLSDSWTSILQEETNYQTLPSIAAVADPFGADQGTVLQINPGVAATTSSANQGVEFALPEAVQISGAVTESTLTTWYFKIARPAVGDPVVPGEVDITYGLVAESARSGEGTHGYGSYSVLGRYEKDGIMDIRDESADPTYQDLTTEALDTNVYYEIWFVIDHFSFTYTQYIKGGTDYPVQTKIYEGALYRNQAVDNLVTMLFFTSAGNIDAVKGKDPIYFDDFHMDVTGVNLNSPDGTDNGGGGASGGKFINISTRGTVGVGDDALIGGFVIGEDAQQVVIQAIGQELAGVTGFLVDPVLSIRNSAGEEIGMNDNWQDTQEQLITDLWGGAPPFADGSLSAGGVWTLDPGSYTAIVTGKDDTTGVALIEVYQID